MIILLVFLTSNMRAKLSLSLSLSRSINRSLSSYYRHSCHMKAKLKMWLTNRTARHFCTEDLRVLCAVLGRPHVAGRLAVLDIGRLFIAFSVSLLLHFFFTFNPFLHSRAAIPPLATTAPPLCPVPSWAARRCRRWFSGASHPPRPIQEAHIALVQALRRGGRLSGCADSE